MEQIVRLVPTATTSQAILAFRIVQQASSLKAYQIYVLLALTAALLALRVPTLRARPAQLRLKAWSFILAPLLDASYHVLTAIMQVNNCYYFALPPEHSHI